MLFCFVRDKLRTTHGRRFQLNQLNRPNPFCRSRRVLSDRPIGHELGGVGLVRRILGQDVS